MNNTFSLKIELDVAGSKVIHQLALHNADMEKAIESGVKAALDELTADGNFELLVKNQMKENILNLVQKSLHSYEIQAKLSKAFYSALEGKIEEYANGVAEKFIKQL